MSGTTAPAGTYSITLLPPVNTLNPGLPSCATGPFAGMPTATVQAALGTAQQALIALLTGGQPVQVMYVEGQGHRQVTYNRANSDDLRQLIKDLQSSLGLYRRRAMGVFVRGC